VAQSQSQKSLKKGKTRNLKEGFITVLLQKSVALLNGGSKQQPSSRQRDLLQAASCSSASNSISASISCCHSLRLACDRERYAFTPLQCGVSRVVRMGRPRQLRKAAELSHVLEKASDLKAV